MVQIILRNLYDAITNDDESNSTSLAFNLIAIVIFVVVSLCFFFPCNRFIPLDRRSAAIMGATMCYATRSFGFPNNKIDIVDAIDFDVLALLTGIMAINFIMIHQKESKRVIRYVQGQIRDNPKSGFWLVSFAAFIISPFLTNDGVCLLFVEPILNAFESIDSSTSTKSSSDFQLIKEDSLFFLIALACSSNIGSAMTYTGNPQNMIVGGDAIEVMSPLRFLFYMSLPSIVSFFLTMLWIQRCWMKKRSDLNIQKLNTLVSYQTPLNLQENQTNLELLPSKQSQLQLQPHEESKLVIDTETIDHSHHSHNQKLKLLNRKRQHQSSGLLSPFRPDSLQNLLSPIPSKPTPVTQKVLKFIITPFPYAMLILMAFMIALIFVDIISIFGLICLTAVFMVVVLVLGNHWQGLPIWGTTTINDLDQSITDDNDYDSDNNNNNNNDSGNKNSIYSNNQKHTSLTSEEKSKNTNEFFEDLFNSLDYNLLFIFLGLFVVVENIDSTGIPKKIWNSIVGKNPFNTFLSVTLISLFILISSQFLGNVPVIQLAKPNVEILDDNEKRYAWAILSFVATVGGNLTITGSAANIIVAEKAARIDPTSQMDFFKHYKICFWITLLSCILGSLIITGIVICDNHLN